MRGFELVKREDHWALYNEDGHKIAATLPGCNSKLSIKNCEAIENGYDLEEISSSLRKEFEIKYNTGKGIPVEGGGYIIRGLDYQVGVIDGFQKAIELLGDKKFSEEDMINAHYNAWIDRGEQITYPESRNRYFKSLQQTEWDVEIEMEENCPYDYTSRCTQGRCNCKKPKLDKNGCLILKRK